MRQNPGVVSSVSAPLILFYTTFFSKPVDILRLTGGDMEAAARFTLDKKHISEVAAVVFHLPNSREMGDAFRYPGQYWIGWSLECGQNYKIQASPRIMKHFDFMMTYETRSDVWCPYLPKADWWRDAKARATPAKTEEAPIALFVSARLNYSGRLDLVDELSKHIKIDSYGRYWHNRDLPGPDLGKATKIETIGRHKFCLAVENSIETDYVTEKIYDCLGAGTVPIYLGAPNVDEFVPPGSYINAAHFGTAAELAAFIRYLCETPEAYESYFRWKTESLPQMLADRLKRIETPLGIRLLRFVEQRCTGQAAGTKGRRTLPFGLRSYIGTRLRKWKGRVPT